MASVYDRRRRENKRAQKAVARDLLARGEVTDA